MVRAWKKGGHAFGEPVRQHREGLNSGIYRGSVMGSMLVGLRVSRDVGIDIRNCYLYLYLSVLAGFAVFQLVEVHGVVVVDG